MAETQPEATRGARKKAQAEAATPLIGQPAGKRPGELAPWAGTANPCGPRRLRAALGGRHLVGGRWRRAEHGGTVEGPGQPLRYRGARGEGARPAAARARVSSCRAALLGGTVALCGAEPWLSAGRLRPSAAASFPSEHRAPPRRSPWPDAS